MNNRIDLNPQPLCEVDGIMVYDQTFTHEIYYELYENLYSLINLEMIRLKLNINLFFYEQ